MTSKKFSFSVTKETTLNALKAFGIVFLAMTILSAIAAAVMALCMLPTLYFSPFWAAAIGILRLVTTISLVCASCELFKRGEYADKEG